MNVKEKLQALLAASNLTTGETDTTLTDAVQSLIDGFGGGDQAFDYDIIEYTATTDSAGTDPGTLYTIPHGLSYTPAWFWAVNVTTDFRQSRAMAWYGQPVGVQMLRTYTATLSLSNGGRLSDTSANTENNFCYCDGENFYLSAAAWNSGKILTGDKILIITKEVTA